MKQLLFAVVLIGLPTLTCLASADANVPKSFETKPSAALESKQEPLKSFPSSEPKALAQPNSKVPADLAGSWNWGIENKTTLDGETMVLTAESIYEDGFEVTVVTCRTPGLTLVARARLPAHYANGVVTSEGKEETILAQGKWQCRVAIEGSKSKYEIRGNTLLLTNLNSNKVNSYSR